MKSIKLKLLIFVGIIIIVCSTILVYRTYTKAHSYVDNLTNQQLSLALNFDLAIREYVAETIRPMMFDLVGKGKFIPEAMSTSFVARSIFEKVRKKFPNYIIKFASGNPRNPVNQAGPEELDMIAYFNDNPDNKVWKGESSMAGRVYRATFSAMRMEKSCLRCHGNPADAPIELIKRYGPNASFYRPLGEVVGMDTIAIPSDTIKKLLLSEKFENLGFLGIVILLLSVSLVFVFKFVITDRLSKISNHFSGVEKIGDDLKIGDIRITGGDEIAGLAKNFNKLAERLNNTYAKLRMEIEEREQFQAALRESEEKYRYLSEGTFEAVVWHDNGNILEANRQYYEMFGYKPEELKEKDAIILTATPDSVKFIKEQISLGHTGPYEVVGMRKDGTVFPMEIRSNKMEYKGKMARMAAIRDLTERKQTEDLIRSSLKEKELLLSEIHHRVKNNFEIVSSLLDMSSMGTENREIKDYLLDSKSRIHSMAMIHSQLYQSDHFEQIDMVRHMEDLGEHLIFLYGKEKKVNLKIEPSRVYLSIKQAIPCALIINELITNSLKYAFVDKKNGKIHVSIHDSNDSKVLLRVKDDGGGIDESVGVKPAGSLGLELVNHLVVGQLKGEINIHHNDGTDICIEFNRQ